jgi:hypothetical protein
MKVLGFLEGFEKVELGLSLMLEGVQVLELPLSLLLLLEQLLVKELLILELLLLRQPKMKANHFERGSLQVWLHLHQIDHPYHRSLMNLASEVKILRV